jgi:thioredoxin 1
LTSTLIGAVLDHNLGPCKQIAHRYEQLSKQFPQVQFLKVNVDDNSDISGEHGVRAMPTFLFFKSGKKIDEVVGAGTIY